MGLSIYALLRLVLFNCASWQRFNRVLEEDFGPVIPGHEAEAATGANEAGDFFDPSLTEVLIHVLVVFEGHLMPTIACSLEVWGGPVRRDSAPAS